MKASCELRRSQYLKEDVKRAKNGAGSTLVLAGYYYWPMQQAVQFWDELEFTKLGNDCICSNPQ